MANQMIENKIIDVELPSGCAPNEFCSDCSGACPMNSDPKLRDEFDNIKL